jgi:hypothetical protein
LRWQKKKLKIFSPGWPAIFIFVAGKVNSGACLNLTLPDPTIYLAHTAEKTCSEDYPQSSWENYGKYWLIIGRKTRYEENMNLNYRLRINTLVINYTLSSIKISEVGLFFCNCLAYHKCK